ncbi:MAG: MFS transporter [Cellulosilyticaceae bacterium]
MKNVQTYNRAKLWQMGLFVFNNTATNLYMTTMGFVSYYAVGIAGLLTAVIGIVLTGMRLFDGVTDPLIGYLIDKTDGKFGKFRPFMIIGNLILATMTAVIFFTTHLVPENIRLVYFIVCYSIYIIGYTFQTACTKAGQVCMTNDPKQRPTFAMFDTAYSAVILLAVQLWITNILVPKHKGFNMEMFGELIPTVIIASMFCTALAVIGIWNKDRKEFFGVGTKSEKIKVKEYWGVIKDNRAIQMLVVAASTDKLAGTIMQNSVLGVIFAGIMVGNYGLIGQLGIIVMIPTLVLGLFLMNLSRKHGMKKAIVLSSWVNIGVYMGLAALIIFGDVTTISLANLNLITIVYVTILIVKGALHNVSSNLVIPMIADCADYEVFRSKKYVPGMMGTLFSFVDKLISSLATTIINVGLAMIGYATMLPQIGDAPTPILVKFYLICAVFIPAFGLFCNVIAMKFYPLDKEKMHEIQSTIAEIKSAA